jgi:hypothetical protein
LVLQFIANLCSRTFRRQVPHDFSFIYRLSSATFPGELRVNLKPCPFRLADDEGHILCDKIKSGDREVTPEICRVCPVAQVNCAHLRATLDRDKHVPITVRWGNGKSTVWDEHVQDAVALTRAACAEKVIPIHTPRDCVGCPLQRPIVIGDQLAMSARPATARQSATTASRSIRRTPMPVPLAQPVAHAATSQPSAQLNHATAADEARSSLVAKKIIQIQDLLAKQNRTPHPATAEPAGTTAHAESPRARVVGEEKRVGWTD